jgi:hypothetical protein
MDKQGKQKEGQAGKIERRTRGEEGKNRKVPGGGGGGFRKKIQESKGKG